MAGESLSVVIMAYNEAENLPAQVESTVRWLERACPEGGQVVIVDDGSTDGTGALADRLAQGRPQVTVVHHPRNLGMGRAIWSGYLAARGEWLTQLPGDGQVPPEALDGLLARRGEGDLILSVYRERGDGLLRRIVSLGFQATAWALLGDPCRFTGTMMFRRSLLHGVTPRSDSFLINVELPLRWMREGVRPVVVPLDPPRPRAHGRSKVLTLGRIRRVVKEMLLLRRELRGTMETDSVQKGLESLVAEGLRRHVLETVLARPEVVRNLSPEALERLRGRIMARLMEAEEAGRAHRETALAALRGLRAAAGPLGDLLESFWQFGRSIGLGHPNGLRGQGERDERPEGSTGPGEEP